MIFVYGIAREDFAVPDGLQGVGEPGTDVRLLAHHGLAAIVSEVQAPPNRRQDLERHVEVMGSLAEAGTLVPMRYGTLFDEESQARTELVDRHREWLQRLLASLDGCVQMTIKAIYEENVPLNEIVQREPDLKTASQHAHDQAARIALGERVAAAVEHARATDEHDLALRADQVAEHVVVEPPGHERMAARLQVLVRREHREALDEIVRTYGEKQQGRMTLRYTGPIAPYSFSDFSLEAEPAGWA